MFWRRPIKGDSWCLQTKTTTFATDSRVVQGCQSLINRNDDTPWDNGFYSTVPANIILQYDDL